jgi:hypothetical protein
VPVSRTAFWVVVITPASLRARTGSMSRPKMACPELLLPPRNTARNAVKCRDLVRQTISGQAPLATRSQRWRSASRDDDRSSDWTRRPQARIDR